MKKLRGIWLTQSTPPPAGFVLLSLFAPGHPDLLLIAAFPTIRDVSQCASSCMCSLLVANGLKHALDPPSSEGSTVVERRLEIFQVVQRCPWPVAIPISST